jgi:hypothetical protein
MSPARRPIFALLFLGWLAAGPLPAARAADGGFAATLTAEQRESAGIGTLSPEQRTALDGLVASDLALARKENLPEIGGTFAARRSEAERQQAGLDHLTAAQLARLNELVAAAVAARPKPRERPRLKENDVLAAGRKPEIHGSVSFAYGWGSGGRDYRASSLWLEYFDPDSSLGLGVGISTFDGDGFGGCFYPSFSGARGYAFAPVTFVPAYGAVVRDDGPEFSFNRPVDRRDPWRRLSLGRR